MATVVVASRGGRRSSLLSSSRNNSQIYLYEGLSSSTHADDSPPTHNVTHNSPESSSRGQKQWTCAVCTFINNPGFLACELCTLPIGALPLKSEYHHDPGRSNEVLRVINREEEQMQRMTIHRTRSRSANAASRLRHSLPTTVAAEGRHSVDMDRFRIRRGSYGGSRIEDSPQPTSDTAVRYGSSSSPSPIVVVPAERTTTSPELHNPSNYYHGRGRPKRMSHVTQSSSIGSIITNMSTTNRRSRSCDGPSRRLSSSSAISELFYLCCLPQGEHDPKWQRVLGWLHVHKSTAQLHPALQPSEEDARKTALHVVCTRQPPISVVQKLLSQSAPECVRTKDAYGWLPLHHACKHGASEGVLYLLMKAFPEGTACVDRWKRGPLHLLFLSTERAVYPDSICTLVKQSKKAQMGGNVSILGQADENGRLPIHYAIKHHASMEVIDFLLEEHPLSLTVCDVRGYSPVDVAVGRMTSSQSYFLTLKKLLTPQVVAKFKANDGDLPAFIKFLAEHPLKHVGNDFDNLQNINKCFYMLLESPPQQNMDGVRSALKSLPSWLQKYLATTISWVHEQLMLRRRISEALSETILKGLKKNRSASIGNKDRRFNSGTSVITDASVSICPDNFEWRKPIANQRSNRQVC